MKNLTAEQILKKTFEHLDEIVDEKGQERRKREKAQDDSEKNQRSKDGSQECMAGEENHGQDK